MSESTTHHLLGEHFEAHRSFLWGLSYRLTGNAADADDIVQETFARALEHPPARLDGSWRPWLVRVALNHGRDLLRRRRRRLEGPWLPAPIETGDDEAPFGEPVAGPDDNPAARYDLLESVSLAFLLALEVLTPAQRAVLLLRDVFGYSVRETAGALGMTGANVKTTHLRARRAVAAYDRTRHPPTRHVQRQTRHAIDRLLACLRTGDVAGLEAVLAADVRAVSDGGEYRAARVPVVGRDKVVRLLVGLTRRWNDGTRLQVRMLNGLPALVVEFTNTAPGWAPRAVLQFQVNTEGLVHEIDTVLASRKLVALR